MRVIAGSARRTQLKTLEGMDTRPTTDRIKETLFNMIAPYLYDSIFLDLFAGSGGIGIEALSRGAMESVFVEKNPKAMACVKENLQKTHFERKGMTMQMDVMTALYKLEGEKHKKDRISIITGPNMAGKSTYMRQTALIVLMAQIGSFVPASSANIGVVDRIFTRVGASDDLASGQSTFMVEMTEVANILRNATSKSLLILDEIGRGTSTFDGLSIAWAVIEYISNSKLLGAKTLFATHYHELTELEGKIENVNNYCIAVKEKGDDIIFLRKIVKGGADKSYGIQVARLAGVPQSVTDRAKEIVEELVQADVTGRIKDIEVQGQESSKQKTKHFDEVDLAQMSLFDTVKDDDVIKEIKDLDLANLTPIDALNTLYQLQNKLKNRW